MLVALYARITLSRVAFGRVRFREWFGNLAGGGSAGKGGSLPTGNAEGESGDSATPSKITYFMSVSVRFGSAFVSVRSALH